MKIAPRPLEGFQFFIDHGLKDFQAAAIIGGFMVEDYPDLRINAVGDKGTAKGLGQWHKLRMAALEGYAAKNGKSPFDFFTELAFVLHEFDGTEKRAGKALRASTTLEQACDAMVGYERPAGWSAKTPRAVPSWQQRYDYAKAILAARTNTEKITGV